MCVALVVGNSIGSGVFLLPASLAPYGLNSTIAWVFTATGAIALAIVFAGNGVFELQNAGILLTTNLAWLGRGLPWVGLYPNLQVISVQGLLLAGAILAWLVVPQASLQPGAPAAQRVGLAAKRS